jgi:prolipoprotein diacylglyceryltransferase
VDDYAPSPCAPGTVLIYETKAISDSMAVDTLNFWQGGMVGYVGALLTVAVIVAVLDRLRPRGGAPA